MPILTAGSEDADVPFAFRSNTDKEVIQTVTLQEQMQFIGSLVKDADGDRQAVQSARRAKKRGVKDREEAEMDRPDAMAEVTQEEDNKDYSLLMKAVARGQLNNVRFLLQSGEDPSFTTPSGVSAMDLLEGKDDEVYMQIRLALLQRLVPDDLRKEALG